MSKADTITTTVVDTLAGNLWHALERVKGATPAHELAALTRVVSLSVHAAANDPETRLDDQVTVYRAAVDQIVGGLLAAKPEGMDVKAAALAVTDALLSTGALCRRNSAVSAAVVSAA